MSKWTKGALATAIAVSLFGMASQAMAKTIKIAIAGPQTGLLPSMVTWVCRAKLRSRINAAGGIDGKVETFLYGDARSQTGRCLSPTRSSIRRQVRHRSPLLRQLLAASDVYETKAS